MKRLILLIMVLGTFAFVFAQSPDQVRNLQRPQFYIYTAGQPTAEGFQQIAELGIKTVINVLPEKQCIPDEPKMVTSNSMAYRSIPFDLTGFRKETIHHFGEILEAAEKPVLIHCGTGNHVGGLWFAYRVLEEKVPLAQALKEGRKIGMKPELEDAIFLWIMNHEQRAAL